MLAAAREGVCTLLIAPTGGGKTLAGFLPSLVELAENPFEGLHTIYISPLKALAVDIARNLMAPVEEMGLPISIETRTGDTPANRRARQREKPPNILLTTPESLTLLLSLADADVMFATLRCVVLDEIHALAGTKRGDQLFLALSRLTSLAPGRAMSGFPPRSPILRRCGRMSLAMPSLRMCASSPWPAVPRPTSPFNSPKAACPGAGIWAWPRHRKSTAPSPRAA